MYRHIEKIVQDGHMVSVPCCNEWCYKEIQRFFSAVKIENFITKNSIFFMFLLKTLIFG